MKDTIFLGYWFNVPEIEDAVRRAVGDKAHVTVAKDRVLGKHILNKIIDQIQNSSLCLFDLTGHNVNVALELGIAIAANIPYRLLYNPGSNLNPQSSRDFFSDLKGWDRVEYSNYDELTARLIKRVPEFLDDIRGHSVDESPLEVPAPSNVYENAISDTLSSGTQRFVIVSYVCWYTFSMRPKQYVANRYKFEELPAILNNARATLGSGSLPSESPLRAEVFNLLDAIQVDTNKKGAAGHWRREFYRFYESGLFVFGRIVPNDIEENGSYATDDKQIGLLDLIGTVTKIARLARNLSDIYGEDALAVIAIHGLGNHRLIDDSNDDILDDARKAAITDSYRSIWEGGPKDFADKGEQWAAEFTHRVLRLLNWADIDLETIMDWQQRLS